MTAMVEELIRERAHQLYLQRGCIDGYAAADWFEAERQILSELNHAVA